MQPYKRNKLLHGFDMQNLRFCKKGNFVKIKVFFLNQYFYLFLTKYTNSQYLLNRMLRVFVCYPNV